MNVYNFSQASNIGDRYCSPHRYFKWLAGSQVLWPWEWTPGKAIFGGGGMLHPGTDHWIMKAVRSGSPTVVWGIGLNYHGSMGQIYPKFLDECRLVGLRELGNPWNFVPCPSCLATDFDVVDTSNPRHDLVIYEHAVESIPKPVGGDAPRKNNQDAFDLSSVLEFLASGRVILTNTYHGAYWSILMKKTPVLFEPFSNRFMALGDLPVADRKTWVEVIKEFEPRQPFVTLTEARFRNLAFSMKAKQFLGL
jgi:hypothetical protein